MPGGVKETPGTEGLPLPAGARARLRWRPPALRAGHALVMRAVAHDAFAARTMGPLQAWHDRMSRRVHPWTGWSPPVSPAPWPLAPALSDTEAGRTALERGPVRPDQTLRVMSKPAAPVRADAAVGGAAIDRAAADAPGILDARSVAGRFGRTAEPKDAVPSSPMAPEAGSGRLETPPSVEPVARPGTATPRLPNAATFQPLHLSVSSQPRWEVRGGFPGIESFPGGPIPSGPAQPLNGVAPRPDVDRPPLPSMTVLASRPGAQPAIERLIERTVRPTPLPGLEIRVVQPKGGEQEDERRPAGTEERSDGGDAAGAPAASPPPPLDINAVTERVYQLLVRRQRFERERRGLY